MKKLLNLCIIVGFLVIIGGFAGCEEVGTSAAASYTNTGLIPGTTYYYKLAASNSGGAGGQSNAVNAATAPGIPAGVTATAASFSSITVSWSYAKEKSRILWKIYCAAIHGGTGDIF